MHRLAIVAILLSSFAAAQQGTLPIQGNSAAAATDGGYPVKVGGVYNSTQPTYTNGQRGDAQISARGALIVATGVDAFNAAQGTAAAASGGWPVKVTDGTSIGAVKAANTIPTLSDPALVAAISPNNTGLAVNLPVIIQKTSQVSSGSVASINKAYTSNVTAGNSLIVTFCNGNVNAPAAPISDTLSSTWSKAVHQVNGILFECDIWYASAVSGGADTITVTPGGGNASIAMEIYELQGLIATIPLDQAVSASGSSTALASGAITARGPNEMAFAAFGVGTAAQTVTVTGGFTSDSGQQNPTTPAGLFSFVAASKRVNDLVVSDNATGTITSEPWVAALATFHPVQLGVQAIAMIMDASGNNRGANVDASNNLGVVVGEALPTGANTIGAVNQGGSNWTVNLNQIVGNTGLTGNGATGTGSLRVTIANDNSAIAGWGLGATAAAVPSGAHYMGGNGSGNLTGVTVCDTWAGISETAGAQIVSGVSAKKIYICSIDLVSATAQNIAVVSGTGTVCATGITSVPGLGGGTTAGTGWNLAANGGLAMGTGFGTIARTTNNADNLCVLQSGSGQVSGGISYTIF